METKFKVSKKGKYVQVKYISGLPYTPISYWDYIWSINVSFARKFIKSFCEIQKSVKEIIENENLELDYRLVMLMFIKNIDSVSDGLSVHSSYTNKELADNFVKQYLKKHNEAVDFCNETMEFYETKGKRYGYMKQWERYDRYNELIRQFYLPFKPLELDDFNRCELTRLSKMLDEMNDLLGKIR